MIGDLEAHLALVLGGRLPLPYRGRVDVEPGVLAERPRLLVSVRRAEPIELGMGSDRLEIVPGSPQPRRVVRARCTLRLRVEPPAGEGRAAHVAALDAALYALEAPDFRDGSALAADGDPGFLVRQVAVVDTLAPIDPAAGDSPPALTMRIEGAFWPRGAPGLSGAVIGSIRLRGAMLPIDVLPSLPLRPGGAAVDVAIRVRLPAGASLPFSSLAVALEGPGGRPPSGALSGGAAMPSGAHLVALADGLVAVRYQPPALPTIDRLVVALDDGTGGLGVELGRFDLVVRAP